MIEEFLEMAKHAMSTDVPKVRGRTAIGGMGGSGIAGRVWADISDSETIVISDYWLPGYIRGRWSFVASSYSGNTEEVLVLFRQALERGLRTVSLTSGGKLARLSARHGVPVVRIPAGYQPRFAFPYSFFYLVRMLGSRKHIRWAEESTESLNEISEPGIRIRGIPVVVGHTSYRAAAYRIATQMSENAKMPAFSVELPEMNHNLITGLESGKGGMHFILIRSDEEHPGIYERMEAMKSTVLRNYRVSEIWAEGSNPIERVLSVIIKGDMLSLSEARRRGANPMETKAIGSLKEHLRTRRTYHKVMRMLSNRSRRWFHDHKGEG